jgi:hypothetical protein
MQATRPKLERRRQTLIHLGLRLSQGGLGAAHRDNAGANVLEFIIDAVFMAQAKSSGVGRTTSARIEGRLQKSVRSIFSVRSRRAVRRTKTAQGREARRLFLRHGEQAQVSRKGAELGTRKRTVIAHGLGSSARVDIKPAEGALSAIRGSLKQAVTWSSLARRRVQAGFIAR